MKGLIPVSIRCFITSVWIVVSGGVLSMLTASEVLHLPRLNGPITLDGFSDEAAWKGMAPLKLTMHQPLFEGVPTEKTEILVAYDDNYLYLAGRMFDSDPGGIQMGAFKRDNLSPSNDWFGIILDTFKDNENGLAFFTSPAGIRFDAAVFNDAEGQFPINLSWNTFWDVAVAQNDQGWFAEIRIPFSSLRFQDDQGRVDMGLIVYRYIARKAEVVVFPTISPKWGPWSFWKPSQAKRVRYEGVYSRNPVYITPYGLGGLGQSFDLNHDQTAYLRHTDPAREVGLDIKYGLSSNLTMDITANTDFAQVEADDEQINLTRFSLFFPEKRLFFQERSSIFDFTLGGPNRLFYSRRIGLSDEGLVPIYGGARLIGRIDDWDVGALNMQTAAAVFINAEDSTVTVPSENFGVLRLRRRVLNPFSYAGGMITSRMQSQSTANWAYALDGILRLSEDDYLTLNWAQTFDPGQEPHPDLLDAVRLRFNWDRRTQEGLGFNLSFSRQGEDYNPGMGFVSRTNYTAFRSRISYGWFPGQESAIFRHAFTLNGFVYQSNSDGRVESAELGSRWDLVMKSSLFGVTGIKVLYEALRDSFYLDDTVSIPPGRYTFPEFEAQYESPMGAIIRSGARFSAGGFYDGWRVSLVITPAWIMSSYFETSGEIELNRVYFPERQLRFNSSIFRLRLKATLNRAISLATFIQYNDAVDAVYVNARFRYNPREGTDLYLVYNEELNTNRNRAQPILPPTDNRTILLKYATTFQTLSPW